MTQDQVIAAAKAARSIWGESAILPFEELERFYAIAYRQGMERAAEICDKVACNAAAYADECAPAIRAHAKNQTVGRATNG